MKTRDSNAVSRGDFAMKSIARAACAATLCAFATLAFPQSPGPLTTTLDARKVIAGADGKESFETATVVKPGDVIEYVASYRNNGKQPLAKLEATLPIPANTEFIAASAKPANAQASVDGQAFLPMPLMRKVRAADGKEIEQQVPTREYRYLRWYPDALGGEKTLSFSARVRVIDDRPPSEPGTKGGGK
jgi:uncharacterized repeat protein (TIGR01451 family)